MTTLTWTSDNERATVEVGYGQWDVFTGRQYMTYRFTLNGADVHTGEDISGPDTMRLTEAMATVASFLDAWNEGDDENADLFPEHLTGWYDQYGDDFYMDVHT